MEPSVKGNQIIFTKEYLLKKFGPYAVDRICGQMDKADREIIYKYILLSAWQPEKTYVNLLATAEKVYGKGDYELTRQIGYYLAQESIPKIYKTFIQFGNPLFVLSNASRFWKQVHNNGALKIVSTGPKSVTGYLTGFAFPHKAFCSSVMGFSQATLEMCGAKNVLIQENKCLADGDDCCESTASWE